MSAQPVSVPSDSPSAPAAAEAAPLHPSVALATQFGELLRESSSMSASVLSIWWDWVHKMDGFDPVVFWSTPVLASRHDRDSSIRPLAHLLFLLRPQMGETILDGVAKDLNDALGTQEGSEAFRQLLMRYGEYKAGTYNLFQAYWKKLLIPPPAGATGSPYFSHVSADELNLLIRLMTATDTAHWRFRDAPGGHPGSGLVTDLMKLVRDSKVAEAAIGPVIALVREAFGRQPSDPRTSAWLDLSADGSGRAVASALVADGHRVDELVRVGTREFPAWEWMYYKNLSSNGSGHVVSMLLPLIEALPTDGSVAPVPLDPRFDAPPAPPKWDPDSEDESPKGKQFTSGPSRLAAARSRRAAAVQELFDAAEEIYREKVWMPGMDREGIHLDPASVDLTQHPQYPDPGVSSLLDRLEQMCRRDEVFDALTPSDNRASTGYIRRVLLTQGTDTLGRPAFMRLMRHRSDLLDKIRDAIRTAPAQMAPAMRQELAVQVSTPDIMGYTPLLWASSSETKSPIVADILRSNNKPLVFGVEDRGLCTHLAQNARWFLSTGSGHSYGMKVPSPIRSVGPDVLFQHGGAALVFGPPEEQQRWVRRLEKTLSAWAATATEHTIPKPTIKNTPNDVLWFMQVFSAVRKAVRDQVKTRIDGASKYHSGYREKTAPQIAQETWAALEGTMEPGLAAACHMFLATAASSHELAIELKLCSQNSQNTKTWTNGVMSARLPAWTENLAMAARTLAPIMTWPCASYVEAHDALNQHMDDSSYDDKMKSALDAPLRTAWMTSAERYLLSQAAGVSDTDAPAACRSSRKL